MTSDYRHHSKVIIIHYKVRLYFITIHTYSRIVTVGRLNFGSCKVHETVRSGARTTGDVTSTHGMTSHWWSSSPRGGRSTWPGCPQGVSLLTRDFWPRRCSCRHTKDITRSDGIPDDRGGVTGWQDWRHNSPNSAHCKYTDDIWLHTEAELLKKKCWGCN